MSTLGNLDSAQSREVEEQLFSTHRLQSTRHMPVPLPRQDFWAMVKQLLNTLDMEIQSMLMKGMTGMRLQNLQKRQANIRHIASELARKRTVAVVQHVASQSLSSSAAQGGGAHERLNQPLGKTSHSLVVRMQTCLSTSHCQAANGTRLNQSMFANAHTAWEVMIPIHIA